MDRTVYQAYPIHLQGIIFLTLTVRLRVIAQHLGMPVISRQHKLLIQATLIAIVCFRDTITITQAIKRG
jgi:hypothetical protein